MWALVWASGKVGGALRSAPILADAMCTMVCIYMSLVLLATSLVYHLTGFGFVDSLGALGLIYFSFNEGREAFEKAAGWRSAVNMENPLRPDDQAPVSWLLEGPAWVQYRAGWSCWAARIHPATGPPPGDACRSTGAGFDGRAGALARYGAEQS